MESMVATVTERLGTTRVLGIRLKVGRLAAVVPDALRFSFDVCTHGTVLEGARLEIDVIEGRGRCRRCGAELSIPSYGCLCACGGADIEVLAGDELRIEHVEVD
jgi:hydrogenase nickel incorporation protein HypA/HybF